MATKTKKKTPAKKKASQGKSAPATSTRTGEKARAAAVKKILLKVEKTLKNTELKATLADYIRLIQLQKEMTPETTTEIRATWVEPKSQTDQ